MKKTTMLTVLVLCGILMSSAAEKVEIALGKPAPEFTLTDSKNKAHTLSEYRGKLVVLEWTNLDCPFVKKHYSSKNMQNLQTMYTQKDVVWLSICSSAKGKQGYYKGADLVKRLKEYSPAPTAYLLDEDGTVGHLYGAKTTPHLYIINPEGNLVYAGAIDNRPSSDVKDIDGATNYVQDALNELLAGKEVTVKATKPYGCSVKY